MSNRFITERIKSVKPSVLMDFFELAHKTPNCISLGVGEPDFETPWHIREDAIYALEKGNTFYTVSAGLNELRTEITLFLNRKYNLNYDPLTEVMVTVGGSEAIDVALRTLVDKGDEVLIPQPSYVAYEPCALLSGATPVYIELKESNGFRLTKDDLEAKITEKTKVLILPYPNNPTGATLTKQDILDIAEVCIKHDIFVITDELYSELVYEDEYYTIASVKNMRERLLYINGFSKTYSMTGWRLGYCCGPKEIIDAMMVVHQNAVMCAPTTSQFAAIAALRNGDKDILQMKESYNERRLFLLDFFKRMDIPCFEPKGCFYVFPNISKYKMTSMEFAKRFLEEEKVVVVPGIAFGDCGEGYLRISYAYSIDDLRLALSRLENFIKKLSI